MTKVLIDIPEDTKGRLSFGITYKSDIEILCKALSNGIVLGRLTNGELFLKLNETAQVYGIDKEKDIIKVCFDNENIVPISYSWWNRKRGE